MKGIVGKDVSFSIELREPISRTVDNPEPTGPVLIKRQVTRRGVEGNGQFDVTSRTIKFIHPVRLSNPEPPGFVFGSRNDMIVRKALGVACVMRVNAKFPTLLIE